MYRVLTVTRVNPNQPAKRLNAPSGQSRWFSTKLFDKILIANRGEIACRVMRTAKRLGIKTVAVYSEADVNALHVKHADEAVCVGPAPSSQSYLNVPAILEAIKKTGAQAVHPGYGFLSENAKFAKTLEENGIAFIGPTSHAIHAMGDKIESKKLAEKAKVHIIPGKLADVSGIDEVIQIANSIGYPVMIKASAGGGGKGMRIAWNEKEAREGFQLAKDEALASFGDDRILIEKYIDKPRHVEIQILADGQGTTLYFNERECSIQRRNQKVLEEAPSPFLDEKTRRAMGQQACQLAAAVGYRSAGTVEFLVDANKDFYFLEMNTRLQVEHPVTEYTTGFDLVELMIRVAAGEKLKLRQEDIPLKGWAMEARVYAEDPLRNFLPSIGTLSSYKEPTSTDGSVRVDAGIEEGGEIQIHYDPLISKLITYGKDRRESIERMKKALDTYVIRGVNHNVCFLRSVLENERYVSGDITTKFIPEEYPGGFKGHALNEKQVNELLAATVVLHASEKSRSLFAEPLKSLDLVLTFNEKKYNVSYISKMEEDHEAILKIGDKEVKVGNVDINQHIFTCIIDGKEVTLQIMDRKTHLYRLQHYGSQYDVNVMTPKESELYKYMPKKARIDTTKLVRSPMPGRIISVAVKPGDKVAIGQELAIIEAMKMRNVIRAERDGVIAKVQSKAGDNIAVDATIIEFQ